MHFSRDVPISYTLVLVRCSGVSVPELAARTPKLHNKRIKKYAESYSGLAPEFDRSIVCRRNKRKIEVSMPGNGLNFDDYGKDLVDKYYIQCLNRNFATRGLTEAYHSRYIRAWGNPRSYEIPGGDIIKYHHISSCSLPTLARRIWGHPEMSVQCGQGCSTSETAHRFLQECTRTRGGRMLRHDQALGTIELMLQREWGAKFSTKREPHIQRSSGLRKPGLI